MGAEYSCLKNACNSDHVPIGSCNRKSLIVISAKGQSAGHTSHKKLVGFYLIKLNVEGPGALTQVNLHGYHFQRKSLCKISCLRPSLTRRHGYQYSNCYGQQESDEGIKMKGKPKQDEGIVSGSGRQKTIPNITVFLCDPCCSPEPNNAGNNT